jgi:hypothetical protein
MSYYGPDVSVDFVGPKANFDIAKVLYILASCLIRPVSISPETSSPLSLVPASSDLLSRIIS